MKISDGQLKVGIYFALICRKCRLYAVFNKLYCLLRASARILFRTYYFFYLLLCKSERRILYNSVEKVVLSALLLDYLTCLYRLLTYLFMQFLTVPAALYGVHHNIFACHERQLIHKSCAHHFRIHDKSV